MGGIEGRRYISSGVSLAREGTAKRNYMKYTKPLEDAQIDPGRLAAQYGGFVTALATGSPLQSLNYAQKGGEIYDYFDNRTFEARRMANNAPGDLTGMAYKGPTRIGPTRYQ